MSDDVTPPQTDWSGFVQRIYINRDRAEVWSALATPGGISSWFTHRTTITNPDGRELAADHFPLKGYMIRFEWTEGASEVDPVIEIVSEDHLRFGWYGDKGWVEFRIRHNNDRLYVELEQRMEKGDQAFIEKAYLGCSPGWAFFLANLKSVLEGGLDLREFKPDIKGLVNA